MDKINSQFTLPQNNWQDRYVDSRFKKITEDIESKIDIQNKDKEEKQLKEACQDFEAVFLNYILKTMRDCVKSDFIKRGAGEDIFTSLHDQELSKKASRTSQLGLADMLYNQLKQTLNQSKNNKIDDLGG